MHLPSRRSRYINGYYYLTDDIGTRCFDRQHWLYFGLGVLWTSLYCLGIPFAHYRLMKWYSVPQARAAAGVGGAAACVHAPRLEAPHAQLPGRSAPPN